jgi:hypothetical protein
VELRGLEPLTSSMPWWPGMHRPRAASLDECADVQALTPPFGPGAPQFAPHASNVTQATRAAILSFAGR